MSVGPSPTAEQLDETRIKRHSFYYAAWLRNTNWQPCRCNPQAYRAAWRRRSAKAPQRGHTRVYFRGSIGALRLSTLYFLILIFAAFCPRTCSSAEPSSQFFQLLIPAPTDPQAQLDMLYTDAQGHIVMQYDLGRIKDDKEYFFDGYPLFGINDSEAGALANNAHFQNQFVAAHDLTQLDFIFGPATRGSTSFEVYNFSAPKCQWPYGTAMLIKRQRKPPLKVMFFHRRKEPKTDTYAVWCELGPGKVKLTTHYENLVPLFSATRTNRQILMSFRRPATAFHVSDDGLTLSSHLPSGIIAIPAALSANLLGMVAEGELPPQTAIDLLETDLGWFAGHKSEMGY